ncbi:MAG: twin-arginine translocation signal domain-containing protein [Candidatus Methylomirabilis sp.]|nr:twin-arginine translocation signal domain-containing protein [Candidatus Methylomirabilis sp.]
MRCCCGGVTRRDLLRYAALGGGALLVGPLAALAVAEPVTAGSGQGNSLPKAKQAMRDIVRRYASVKDDPWAMMHGVRAFGKNFMLDEGPAVDYLCSHFLEMQTVRGGHT